MSNKELTHVDRTIPSMGTYLEVLLYHRDGKLLGGLLNDIEEEVQRLDHKLSRFITTSEVSRINRFAGKEPVLVDFEMLYILETALAFCRETDGAFDITVGPLLELWGFYSRNFQVPDSTKVAYLRQRVGCEKVILDRDKRTIKFALDGMAINLGGLGKGYALEQIIALLQEFGIKSAFLSFGGSSIYAMGATPRKLKWSFSYKVANKEHLTPIKITLRDEGFSVSANYNLQFRDNHQTYGHIFDPKSGKPTQQLISAAVIHKSPLRAEILSTAFMVMGRERCRQYFEAFKDTKGLLTYINPADGRIVIERLNF